MPVMVVDRPQAAESGSAEFADVLRSHLVRDLSRRGFRADSVYAGGRRRGARNDDVWFLRTRLLELRGGHRLLRGRQSAAERLEAIVEVHLVDRSSKTVWRSGRIAAWQWAPMDAAPSSVESSRRNALRLIAADLAAVIGHQLTSRMPRDP